MTPETPAAIIVTTSVDTEAAALQIARAVVQERLAACVHVTPITSVYRWDDKLVESREWSCLIKTTVERVSALQQRLTELHPYQVPEILALSVLAGNSRYLEWLADSVRDP